MSSARQLQYDLRRTKIRFLLLALLIPALFISGSLAISHTYLGVLLGLKIRASTIGEQLGTSGAPIRDGDLRAYRAFAGEPSGSAPLILAFHDIQSRPRSQYALTPGRFESHMAMLEEAGFTTLTSDQFAAYLHGASVPPRSVVLTFDDGTQGLWTYADAILRRHGFHGIAFVITASVERTKPSYYLTWDELRQMHSSGIWDIESHSKSGHGLIKVDAKGSERPFFVSRQWLPAEQRVESIAEFGRRTQADLDGSIEDLRHHGFAPPRFFAHPRSAGISDTNDPTTIAVVGRMLRERFVASVTNSNLPRAIDVDVARRRVLPRLEVYRDTTTRALFARIAATSPRPLSKVSPFRTPHLWMDGTGLPLQPSVSGDRIVLWQQGKQWCEAYYAPGRTASWLYYRASVTINGLSDHRTSAGMTVLAGSESELRVTVSARSMSIRVGSAGRYRTVRTLPLQAADHHRIAAIALPGRVLVSVDTGPALSISSGANRQVARGGIGLYVFQSDATASLPIFQSLLITPISRGNSGW